MGTTGTNRIAFVAALVLSMLIVSRSSPAGPVYDFQRITNPSELVDVGRQLTVGLSPSMDQAGSAAVTFTFRNSSSAFVDAIHFDDSHLFAPSTGIVNGNIGAARPGSGLQFPGAEPPFEISRIIRPADGIVRPEVEPGGNIGQYGLLTVQLSLLAGKTFQDALAAIQLGGAGQFTQQDSILRIGLDVRPIVSLQNSDHYVNSPSPRQPAAVPLPAAAWMGFGLLGSLGAAKFFKGRRQML